MTSGPAIIAPDPSPGDDPARQPAAIPTIIQKGFWRQAFEDTFQNLRARLGAAWIAVLVLMAVFAPFLANTHPLFLRANNNWSSPLLQSLTQIDVTLLITFFAALFLITLVRTFTWPQRFAGILWVVAVSIPLTYWPAFRDGISPWWFLPLLFDIAVIFSVPWFLRISKTAKAFMLGFVLVLALILGFFPINPPQSIDYSIYRDAQRHGKIQDVYYAPVPYSANDRQRDIRDARLQPPSRSHWLGTESNGGDVLSWIIHASRIALAIGFISTGIAVTIGIVIGAITGYFAGRLDIIGMRLIEIFEAVPTLVLLLTFVAFFGRNLYLMMAIIGLVSWTGDARFVRAEFLRLRNQDFVQAATALGLPLRSILFRHMLPNGIAPVLVSASFGVASAILYEATLSFLGLGLVDQPSWGQLLNQVTGSAGGTFKWWLALYPGLMIFLTVYAYNLVGESLRDALDPKLRGVK